jgi:hypothetical protein
MAGFSTTNNEHLIRSNLWSKQIKEILEDELMGNRYVRMLDFPDGDTLNIPSIGQMQSRDYTEGQQVVYDAMDTGNFTFTITDYKSSGTYITNKMKQDSFYMNELVSSFVPKQARALAVAMEQKILAAGPAGQVLASTNLINNAPHPYVGTGTGETITVTDFARANYALDMANVPHQGRVAIVHPSVAFALGTITNLVNLSNNPHWEGLVRTGHMSGMKFIVNVLGFDVYTSMNLRVNTAAETITVGANPALTVAAGVNNLFFSAASDVLPFVGSIRQSPRVDSEYNKDFQREEYVTTCRYGYKLFRPENLVVILTDTDAV